MKKKSIATLGIETISITPLKSVTLMQQNNALDCNISCAPLPVQWLKFEGARLSESLCSLEWLTSNEPDTRGFDVERSLGNTASFAKVGYVPAKKTTAAAIAYNFDDDNDFAGTSYYRLRQIDEDLRFTYSKTIAIAGYNKEEGIALFPNPSPGIFQTRITSAAQGKGQLTLMDISGKTIRYQENFLRKGLNLDDWDMTNLATGTYILNVLLPSGNNVFIKLVRN